MPTAYIQVPAFQEGPSMLPVLSAIAEQEPPDGWTVERELWVTLSPPDKQLCDTWQAALDARGFEVYEAPRGKLSARNAAHRHAAEDGADAIVTWDADARPLDDHTLAAALEPLDYENVVAVNSTPVATEGGLAPLVNVAVSVEDRFAPQMHGQLSAFTAEAWEAAGPFDTDLDQSSVRAVRSEEEFEFRRRLDDVGEVWDATGARVENNTRRVTCRISQNPLGSGAPDDYCRRRTGTTTFSPAEERRRAIERQRGANR